MTELSTYRAVSLGVLSDTRRVKTGSYTTCVGAGSGPCTERVFRPPSSMKLRCPDCAEAERLRLKRENARRVKIRHASERRTDAQAA